MNEIEKKATEIAEKISGVQPRNPFAEATLKRYTDLILQFAREIAEGQRNYDASFPNCELLKVNKLITDKTE